MTIIFPGSSQHNDYIKKLEEENEVLEQQIAAMLDACKDIDQLFSSRQGLDYDYWSQEEKDLHEKARQAIALVEGDTDG